MFLLSFLKKHTKPLTIEELFANDDVRSVIEDFRQEDMAEASNIIILWQDCNQKYHLRTNLSHVTCGEIFLKAYKAI